MGLDRSGKAMKMLENAPLGAMVRSYAKAIADAQHDMDKIAASSVALFADTDENGIQLPGRDEKVSLLELGFTPTFYHFQEVTVTARVAFTFGESHAFSVGLQIGGGAMFPGGFFAASVNASYSGKYSFSGEGSSELRAKIISVPPPDALNKVIAGIQAKQANKGIDRGTSKTYNPYPSSGTALPAGGGRVPDSVPGFGSEAAMGMRRAESAGLGPVGARPAATGFSGLTPPPGGVGGTISPSTRPPTGRGAAEASLVPPSEPAPRALPASESDEIAIELRDSSGAAMAGARYELRSGTSATPVHVGALDSRGRARVIGLGRGPFTLRFPDFDGRDWTVDTSPPPPRSEPASGGAPSGGAGPSEATRRSGAARPTDAPSASPALRISNTEIGLHLASSDGAPAAGARYVVVSGTRTVATGALNSEGRAIVADLPAGLKCTVRFPDFDGRDWAAVPPPPEGAL